MVRCNAMHSFPLTAVVTQTCFISYLKTMKSTAAALLTYWHSGQKREMHRVSEYYKIAYFWSFGLVWCEFVYVYSDTKNFSYNFVFWC